jgi:hypothetical protein
MAAVNSTAAPAHRHGMIGEGGGRGAVFVDGKVIMTPN